MKYVIFFLSFLICAGLEAQENKQFTIDLSEPGKKGQLQIRNQQGPVEIKGTSRKDILISYQSLEEEEVKMTKADNGLTKISGGGPGFDVIEQNNKVEIQSSFMNKGVKFAIEIPLEFDVNVQAFMKGDVKVDNIKGEVVIENFNGGIEANDISGHVIANSFNGPIKVSFNQVTPDAPMAFTNHVGDVDLSFPASLKASFKIKADQGDLYTGFEMNVTQEELKTENKEGQWKRTFLGGWVNAKVNGGGPEIKIRSHNGDVYIRKK